jgi:drug/metabolite transporter (DMT)-like permease
MVLFALLSSGMAFLLYFRLIADIGPTRSLTVTFLMPAFTMIWAALFLGETVTIVMILGCGLILGGTALVVMRR